MLASDSLEQLAKLKQELEELQKAYTSVSPTKIVTVEDLR